MSEGNPLVVRVQVNPGDRNFTIPTNSSVSVANLKALICRASTIVSVACGVRQVHSVLRGHVILFILAENRKESKHRACSGGETANDFYGQRAEELAGTVHY